MYVRRNIRGRHATLANLCRDSLWICILMSGMPRGMFFKEKHEQRPRFTMYILTRASVRHLGPSSPRIKFASGIGRIRRQVATHFYYSRTASPRFHLTFTRSFRMTYIFLRRPRERTSHARRWTLTISNVPPRIIHVSSGTQFAFSLSPLCE